MAEGCKEYPVGSFIWIKQADWDKYTVEKAKWDKANPQAGTGIEALDEANATRAKRGCRHSNTTRD